MEKLIYNNQDYERDVRRKEHYATPLSPWTAEYPGTNNPYFTVATDHVAKKVEYAFDHIDLADFGVYSKERRYAVRSFVDGQVFGAHANRVQYNDDPTESLQQPDNRTPELERAFLGIAPPKDIMKIMHDYPMVRALEVAKLTHPFSITAPDVMDEHVVNTMQKNDALFESPSFSHKRTWTDEEQSITGIMRKVHLGRDGDIDIFRRQLIMLIAPDDEPTTVAEKRLTRAIRRDDEVTNELISEYIDNYFANPDDIIHPMRPIPLATSYYARRDLPIDE